MLLENFLKPPSTIRIEWQIEKLLYKYGNLNNDMFPSKKRSKFMLFMTSKQSKRPHSYVESAVLPVLPIEIKRTGTLP